jgi:hypothetical protein
MEAGPQETSQLKIDEEDTTPVIVVPEEGTLSSSLAAESFHHCQSCGRNSVFWLISDFFPHTTGS